MGNGEGGGIRPRESERERKRERDREEGERDGWMSGREPGLVKGLVPRHSERLDGGWNESRKDGMAGLAGGGDASRSLKGSGPRAIGQKQSVATECSTRTKEHRGGPGDKRLIFVFCRI